MPMPYLSMCAVIGDAHAELLPRMLRSLLDRPGGPACDEIVIGWNGQETANFARGLESVIGANGNLAYRIAALRASDPAITLITPGVNFVIHRYEWTGNFAQARQDNFEHAHGEWRGYIDGDDRLALPDDPQVHHSQEADFPEDEQTPTTPFKGSLMDWLAAQPSFVNCIRAPYHYSIAADTGRPIRRLRRPRIVRWDPWWAWTHPSHELLEHALARSIPVYQAGLVFVHEPVLSEKERSARNYEAIREQVEEVQKRGVPLSDDLAYGLADRALDAEDYAGAAESFEHAARMCPPHSEKRFTYFCMAGRSRLSSEQYREAAKLASETIECSPERPEGFLLAAAAAFGGMLYDQCIHWYEAGGNRPPPPAVMIDDRVERCLRPVRTVGVAYLRLEKPEKALAVAERALKEAIEPFSLRIRDRALEDIRYYKLLNTAANALIELCDAGFPAVAARILPLYEPILRATPQGMKVQARLDAAGRKEPSAVPATSIVREWFQEADPKSDLVSAVPMDAAVDPSAVLAGAMEILPEGRRLFAITTDPADLSGYAAKTRLDAVTGETLLSVAERYGDVEVLRLLEDHNVGTVEPSRFLALKVKKRKILVPRKPDITFFCPIFAEPWGPWRLIREGTGGSEESVIYLAKELTALGAEVDVYAPLDGYTRGVHVEDRVRWRPLDALDMSKVTSGLLISHRAPEAIRYPFAASDRFYVWHQDSWYSHGQWSKTIAEACKNLWVSNWQRQNLLKPLELETAPGFVLGNAIPLSAADAWPVGSPRRPLECAYLSSPLRGLEQLLEVWPEILVRYPEARLNLYYGWATTPIQASRIRDRIMTRASRDPTIIWNGRLPQRELEVALPAQGVWLYPCMTDLEGYCIAGVRAAAAGLIPVYRKVAALEEIQYPSPFAVPGGDWDKAIFLDAALRALEQSAAGTFDREALRTWARGKTWTPVAHRLLEELPR